MRWDCRERGEEDRPESMGVCDAMRRYDYGGRGRNRGVAGDGRIGGVGFTLFTQPTSTSSAMASLVGKKYQTLAPTVRTLASGVPSASGISFRHAPAEDHGHGGPRHGAPSTFASRLSGGSKTSYITSTCIASTWCALADSAIQPRLRASSSSVHSIPPSPAATRQTCPTFPGTRQRTSRRTARRRTS
jgi:hypothetical protein